MVCSLSCSRVNGYGVAAILVTLAFLAALPAAAGGAEGRWRVEGQGFVTFDTSRTEHEGDLFFTGSVEYEMPVLSRGAVGVRFYPLFLLDPHTGSRETVFGTAAGVTGRVYQKAEVRKGWFAEAGVSALWHSRYFEGNGSRINFMSEFGVGYHFENDVHLSGKYSHISNAGMKKDNAGVNGVGLAVGYSF